ncbi:DoxX family protein [Niallia sp. NCCP-28]|uniref:DoxX family protein n=1 Tax=Niallia sp. NCCP-28 TaxID=2934712 RepID=UPI00208BF7BE|nr:DoxX family protein [Niallia sp. NCCP-28]GKU81840.1 hypothetical protein NCCP28_12360 [Niallia sp. NCCP-28]
MFISFIRENKIAAGILTLLRLYLGYSWLTSGWGKLTGGSFDAGGFLANAVNNPVKGPDGTAVYSWYTTFLDSFALPNVELFNTLIPIGEVLVGLGLILGCLTTAAAFFGCLMNFSFLLAGTISHNPTDILLSTILLTAGLNAGYYGLDRWVIPYVRKTMGKRSSDKITNTPL